MNNRHATRRPDGKPETPADTRFFTLRESGYAGPIDQDGRKVTDDWVTGTGTGRTYSACSAHPGLHASASQEWPQWRQQMRGTYAAHRMRCPGCGERAVYRPPTDLVPWQAHGMSRPQWSHADGSALCPVMTPGGYQPATPLPPGGTATLGLPASDAEFPESCAQLLACCMSWQTSSPAGRKTWPT